MREKLIEIIMLSSNGLCYLCGDGERRRAVAGVIADNLIANGVTIQRWIPASDPPKETGHYLVNIHQEDDESGDTSDFVLDAWYTVNGLLYVPQNIGWSLLNEWYDLTEKMRQYITHWMPLPEAPKGE